MRELRRGGDLRPVLLICVLAAMGYAAYALLRHFHYWSALDTGIFNQAIWHYSNFEAPDSTVKGGLDLRADHFHPILMVLAPLYWIADEPALLLVAQAGLVAASIVPVFLFARDRLERGPAYAIALAYALFWGVWAGVGFDFHELAFAPLLVALGILWGDRRQWGRFAAAMVLLTLVKEDMTLVVAFFGVWLLSRGDWVPGAATAVGGFAACWLVTKVAMPDFGDGVGFQYWTYDRLGDDLPDAAWQVATHPWLPFEVALDDGQKLKTMGGMLAPFLALSLCSRVGLLAVPLVAERMLSSNPQLWVAADTHYTLPLAPVLAMAAAAGLANVAGLVPREHRRRAVAVAAVSMLVLAVAFNALAAKTPSRIETYASQRPFAQSAARALDRVPGNASVASQEVLYSRLSARETSDVIRPGMVRVDYIVAGIFDTLGKGPLNGSSRVVGDALRSQLPEFDPVFHDHGWVVLRRHDSGGAPRAVLEPFPAPEAKRLRAAALDWAGTVSAFANPRRAQARLDELLRHAGDSTAGGCGDMAAGARRASREMTALTEAVLRATGGSRGGPRAVEEALTAARRAVEDRDLIGRVLTVTELCARPTRR